MTPSPPNRFGSGKSIARVEDDALLRGRGQFSDNLPAAGHLYACFVRSPHPHASITRIGVDAAAAMPGVHAVLTGADLVRAGVRPIPNSTDFRRADGSATVSPPHHALAVDTVRFVGEAVVAVIAATPLQARDAAERIDVAYAPLPAVVDTVAAASAGAPRVVADAPDNIACEIRHGDPAAAAAAFARAAHVVALDLVNQRVAACPIEPRSTLATFDAGTRRLTLRVSCQTPTGLRDELCDAVLGIPKDSVRVIVGDVGGGFGMKTSLYPEDIVVAFAARELGKPVRFTADRMEELLGASHGRDVSSKAELALDDGGRILALRVASLANVGAYATPAGVVIQLMIGPWVSTSIYDIATIDIGIKAVLTHTLPTGPYRGAGRPEAIYIIERLMDEAARTTGIDRTELRRRNMIRPEQMPYTNAMAKTYDSGQFAKVMDGALALSDWRGFDARAADAKRRGKLRGQGIATFLEWTGADAFEETVDVEVTGAGTIELFTAAQPMGRASRRRSRNSPSTCSACQATRSGYRSAIPIASPASAVPARGRCSSSARPCASRRSARSPRRMTLPRARSRRRPATSSITTVCSALRERTGASACSSLRAKRRTSGSSSVRPAPSSRRAGRMAATCAKSSSIPKPVSSNSTATGRSTMSAASSIRWSSSASSKVAPCKASARRCASGSSTTSNPDKPRRER